MFYFIFNRSVCSILIDSQRNILDIFWYIFDRFSNSVFSKTEPRVEKFPFTLSSYFFPQSWPAANCIISHVPLCVSFIILLSFYFLYLRCNISDIKEDGNTATTDVLNQPRNEIFSESLKRIIYSWTRYIKRPLYSTIKLRFLLSLFVVIFPISKIQHPDMWN